MIKGKTTKPFAMLTIKMLESPAWRTLSLSAWRVLSRIEIEHSRHRGRNNGRLPVTFSNFEDYGLHRHAIGPALRELEALGLIEITEHGVAGNAGYSAPNLFRLTYRAAAGKPATDDWAGIASAEQAERVARTAREAAPGEWRVRKARSRVRTKQFPSGGNRTGSSGGNRTGSSAETAPATQKTHKNPGAETAPLSRHLAMFREAARGVPPSPDPHRPTEAPRRWRHRRRRRARIRTRQRSAPTGE